ncbi:hypothetical protein V3C99_018790 [Haemonchus contortus]
MPTLSGFNEDKATACNSSIGTDVLRGTVCNDEAGVATQRDNVFLSRDISPGKLTAILLSMRVLKIPNETTTQQIHTHTWKGEGTKKCIDGRMLLSADGTAVTEVGDE